jgi:tripartite-type tricarboxylate transporter receptor subunit TctC
MRISREIILTLSAVALVTVGFAPQEVRADKVADFYKGNTLTITVGYGPSGGYALYARQLIQYWPKYIPGNPSVIIKFMPGGGGLRAGNYMYKVAPKDGSMIGMISDYVAVAQLMRPKKVKYDARKFKWIGVMVPANPVVMAWHTAKVQSFDQLLKNQLIIGLTGPLAQSGINTALMNTFLGTKFKRIFGYKSTGKIALLMEQGEVEASMSSWISWKARKFKMIQEGKYVPIIQVGMTKAKDLPNVPLMRDYAKNEKMRQVLDLASGAAPFGRSFMVPPGFPDYLLAGLRKAFDRTMKDPEFLASAKKRHIEIDPQSGASLDPVLRQILATPKEIVAMAQDAARKK